MLWDKTVFEMVLLHAYLSVRYNQGLRGSAPGPTRKPEDDPPPTHLTWVEVTRI